MLDQDRPDELMRWLWDMGEYGSCVAVRDIQRLLPTLATADRWAPMRALIAETESDDPWFDVDDDGTVYVPSSLAMKIVDPYVTDPKLRL